MSKKNGASKKSLAASRKADKKTADKAVDNGMDLLDDEKYTEAQQQFESALRVHPDSISAYYGMGLLQMSTIEGRKTYESSSALKGDLATAFSHFDRVIQLDTSRRGETTGYAHRIKATAIATYLDILASENERPSLLQMANDHFEKAAGIMQGSKELDTVLFDYAELRIAVFDSKVSIYDKYLSRGNFDISWVAEISHLCRTSVDMLASALNTPTSSGIDKNIISSTSEVLISYWDFITNRHIEQRYPGAAYATALSSDPTMMQSISELRSLAGKHILQGQALFEKDINAQLQLCQILLNLIVFDLRANYVEEGVESGSMVASLRTSTLGIMELFTQSLNSPAPTTSSTETWYAEVTAQLASIADLMNSLSEFVLYHLATSPPETAQIIELLGGELEQRLVVLMTQLGTRILQTYPTMSSYIEGLLMNNRTGIESGGLDRRFASYARHLYDVALLGQQEVKVVSQVFRPLSNPCTSQSASMPQSVFSFVEASMAGGGSSSSSSSSSSTPILELDRLEFVYEVAYNLACVERKLGHSESCRNALFLCRYIIQYIDRARKGMAEMLCSIGDVYLRITNGDSSVGVSESIPASAAEFQSDIGTDVDLQGVDQADWYVSLFNS
jgi:hypothetical protein